MPSETPQHPVPPVRLSTVPATEEVFADLPGPVLFISDELVVGLRGVAIAGDVPRLVPITPATQALVEEHQGPMLGLLGGWMLSLAGAGLAWVYSGQHLGLGIGVAAMFAGSWLVHRYIESCTTRLVLREGDRVCELACRVRRLGDDADALHHAQRAVQYAATLLDERLARQQLAAAQHRKAWPAAQIQALLQAVPDHRASTPVGRDPLR